MIVTVNDIIIRIDKINSIIDVIEMGDSLADINRDELHDLMTEYRDELLDKKIAE